MIVTKAFIYSNKTKNGGWTYAQIALLGEPLPPVKGWAKRAIGNEISQETADKFIEYANLTGTKKQNRQLAQSLVSNNERDLFAMRERVERNARKELKSKLFLERAEKGPVSPASNDFLKTYEWRKVRMQAIKRYGAICVCCGATPSDGESINIDHIKPRRLFPQLALDIENLQPLCQPCNHGKGNWDMTDHRPESANSFDPKDEFSDRFKK